MVLVVWLVMVVWVDLLWVFCGGFPVFVVRVVLFGWVILVAWVVLVAFVLWLVLVVIGGFGCLVGLGCLGGFRFCG